MCLFLLLHYSLLYALIYQFKHIHISSQTTDFKVNNQLKTNTSIHPYFQAFLISTLVDQIYLGKFKALEVGEVFVS